MKRLISYQSKNGTPVFCFSGVPEVYDEWDGCVKIMEMIRQVIRPDTIDYAGPEDITGYFEKDGIRVEVFFVCMVPGTFFEYRGGENTSALEQIRVWLQQILDQLPDE